MGKTRIIPIVEKKPINPELTHVEINEKTAKCMEGKGHIADGVSRWDFLDKHKWALSTVMGNPDDVINGSFDCSNTGKYLSYLCINCEGIFRLPFKVEKCIFCEHDEIKTSGNKVRMREGAGRAGVSNDVNPDLYKQAVKDIQENGTPESNQPDMDLDWQYLEDNI